MTITPVTWLNIRLSVLLITLTCISLLTGHVDITLDEMLGTLSTSKDSSITTILFEIRLPRTLIAIIIGASLGICGAAVQGLLRNPLASPDLTGATSGGALGAVIMIYFGAASLFGVIGGGMLGSLIATWLVHRLAGEDQSGFTLVLAGMAISSFSIALISLLLNLAPNPYAVQEIVVWMLGSVADLGMHELMFLLPVSLLAWLLLAGTGRGLDTLSLGPETATTLGTNLKQLQRRIFFANSLAVGAAVSIAGSIGFVGLVVPHLLRPAVGWMPGLLLVPCALGGGAMVLTADILIRMLPPGSDLKIGVVTSLAGAPFFLQLILRTKKHSL